MVSECLLHAFCCITAIDLTPGAGDLGDQPAARVSRHLPNRPAERFHHEKTQERGLEDGRCQSPPSKFPAFAAADANRRVLFPSLPDRFPYIAAYAPQIMVAGRCPISRGFQPAKKGKSTKLEAPKKPRPRSPTPEN